jgi:predicted Ser/Thr protein kinase
MCEIKQYLILSEEKFIGKGIQKRCYIHPDDNSLCVKIVYNSKKQPTIVNPSIEAKYNEKLKDRNIPILPKYYGKVSTDFGEGYVYELVKDDDGANPAISLSLHDYISSDLLLKENFDQLVDGLKRFKADMLFYEVVTTVLYPGNILCKKTNGGFGRFIIIDDIGSAALIPIEYYFTFAAHARINRKWKRLIEYIKTHYKNEMIDKLIKQISSDEETVLSDEYFVGKGLAKKCFVHPKNSGLCIKVPYTKSGKREMDREMKYFDMLKKRGVWCDILPEYYGKISTNFGTGYIFEFIKDYDGKVSQTLIDYLSSDFLLKANFSILVNKLKALKEKMLTDKIITMGIFPGNILLKKDSENSCNLIFINDMGSAALIPIEYYFAFAACNRINRKWDKFADWLIIKFPNPLVHELAEQIR